MPRVRLFAGLREAARTSELEIEGATVGEVLEAASSRFGTQFTEGLATAKIWRNGEEVDTLQPVDPDDEIALLPPVSGGSIALGRDLGSGGLATLVVVAALVLGNMVGDQDLWTPILAAMVGLWTFDVAGAAAERGYDLAIGSLLGGQLAAMALIHLLGPSALLPAVAMGVIFPLGAATFVPRRRQLPALGIAAGVGAMSCGAVASLMLARAAFEPGGRAIGFFLLVMIGTIILAEVVRRMRSNRLLNRQNTVVIGVVALSIIGAVLWGFSVTDFLLIGFGLSAAYLAGEGFGTVLRSGRLWSSPLPGILSSLDGPLCAGLVFFALLTLIL
ncbi:MAG: MoaD/ThiS family protein [bacterium]|nr:MoaD/ThiS family protein [bacterium]